MQLKEYKIFELQPSSYFTRYKKFAVTEVTFIFQNLLSYFI
jgi:hypothetical protein